MKLREVNLGKIQSLESRNKRRVSMLGKNKYERSSETKKRMSDSAKVRTRTPLSEEHRKKISQTHTGMRFTPEQRTRLSGKNHPNWQGGITPLNRKIRTSFEYKEWRKEVVERDSYTCVWCNLKQGWYKEEKKRVVVHADHIKPFCDYPELRFDLNNGRTLCAECHRTTETYGGIRKK